MTSRLPHRILAADDQQKYQDPSGGEPTSCTLAEGQQAPRPFDALITDLMKSAGPLSQRLFDTETLRQEILSLIGPTLVYLLNEFRLEGRLDGETPEDRYQHFETSARRTVLPEIEGRFLPILTRLRSRLAQMESLCSEVIERFREDRDELTSASIIPPSAMGVRKIDPVGDVHAGSATCRVTCSDETVLYYKPRNSSADLLVQAVSDTLRDAAEKPRIRVTPQILDRSEYHWAQRVAPAPCASPEGANEYYERAGHLLLVAHVLRLTDLHYENVIPSIDTPCVVDAEAIFTTAIRRPTFPTLAARDVNDAVMSSVSGSGMLPVGTGSRLHGGDISAFSPGHWKSETRVLINPGRDDLRFEKKLQERTDTRHLPYWTGDDGAHHTLLPVLHVEAIVNGFTESYRALTQSIPLIKALISQHGPKVECRLLARRTGDYGTFLSHIWSVSNLARQDSLYERLRASATGIPDSVVTSEIEQIKNGDIPLFRCLAGKTEIYDPSGRVVATLDQPPLDVAIAQFSKLGDADLELQQQLIRFAFESEQSLSLINPQRLTYNREYRGTIGTAIERLWEDIQAVMVTSEGDGSVNWLSLGVDDLDQLELRPLIGSLYAGTPGLAIGALSYRALTGNTDSDILLHAIHREARDAFRRTSASERTLFSYYNGALGHLSAVRALAAAGIGDAEEADHLTDEFLSRCAAAPLDTVGTDVIGGTAGTVIAVASLRDTDGAGDVVTRLAEHLAGLRGSDWFVDRPRAIDNASFAHGSSGIATALLHASVTTGREDFLEHWRSAWKHDESFRSGRTWVDRRREDGRPSANWCHGLTGLMLSRERWLALDDDYGLLSTADRSAVETELLDAAAGVEEHGLLLDSFCLCHGVSGNLLALEAIAHRLPDRSWDIEWSYLAGYGLERGWLCGLSDHFQSYSVMTGLPGILHALCEYAMPGQRSSPLLVPNLSWGEHAR